MEDTLPRTNARFAEEPLGVWSDPCGLPDQTLVLEVCVAQCVVAVGIGYRQLCHSCQHGLHLLVVRFGPRQSVTSLFTSSKHLSQRIGRWSGGNVFESLSGSCRPNAIQPAAQMTASTSVTTAKSRARSPAMSAKNFIALLLRLNRRMR